MQYSHLRLIMFSILLSVSASAQKRHDEICSKIADFAASSEPGMSHAIILRGGWGGDTPDTIMTHECSHSGYAPGKKLCAYLLPNSSWEFGVHNAERAAECLDSGDRHRFVEELKAGKEQAEITSSLQLLRDKRVHVTLHFRRPQASGISEFAISASPAMTGKLLPWPLSATLTSAPQRRTNSASYIAYPASRIPSDS